MSRTGFLAVLVFQLLLAIPAIAQEEYPREFTNPDEIVAFDRSTNYEEAIEVINQFYQEYRNKFIIDQTGTSGAIGVSLPAMHWEDALNFILRLKNLGLVEDTEFVEILPLSALVRDDESDEAISAPQVGAINLETREVRINATFFEGNRRALQEIGVDWSTLSNNVPEDLNLMVAGEGASGGVQGIPQTGFTDQFVAVNSFNAATVSQNVFNALVNFGELGAGISVQALFSAFEADNLGEVLATPFTKVMDGQEGRVQVGQDFSIKQRDIAGNVTDQFFSTGTILTVTPTVIIVNDTSFIHLDVEVERSSAQPDAVSTIINKQEASTQALLLDGEATTIAGLYRTEENRVRRGVPILKDLPWWFLGLRYIFGYNSNDYVENELIIIVQATLEEPLAQRAGRQSFSSKRSVLDTEREQIRVDLDRVFQNELATQVETQAAIIDKELPLETEQPVVVTELVNNEDEISSTETTSEEPLEEDNAMQLPETNDVEPAAAPDELTKEQRQLAEELSLPVDSPELMVMVPRAFSLDEYLNRIQNGENVEEENPENLRYFVIAGSFIVKNNAARFNASLEEQGYDTRVLFHPNSRFNFVAYKGFSDFDTAVNYLREVRAEVNSDSWLFVMPKQD